MLHTLRTTQFIRKDLDTVWEFISDPHNLAKITPDNMGFQVITDVGNVAMYPGQIIEYHVRPLAGIQLHWVTEITHVKEKQFFVDEQRFGPYAFWHHQHFIKEVNGGVQMDDIVHYKLPFGALGRITNALLVKHRLKEIFDYRYQAVEKLFHSEG